MLIGGLFMFVSPIFICGEMKKIVCLLLVAAEAKEEDQVDC